MTYKWTDADLRQLAELEAELLPACPLRPLGWDRNGKTTHWQCNRDGMLHELRSGISVKTTLQSLATTTEWERYARSRGMELKGPLPWDAIGESLFAQARAHGLHDPLRVRGAGLWHDNNRVVWHRGGHLLVDGTHEPLAGAGELHYYYRNDYPVRLPAPRRPQGRRILQLVKNLGWRHRNHGLYLAGQGVISAAAGLLPKRPIVIVSGHHAIGKSERVRPVLAPLAAGLSVFFDGSGSSEAGIRQMLGGSASAVWVDEAEKVNERVWGLGRACWDGDKPVVKGTPTGQQQQFLVRHSLTFSGINIAAYGGADRTRALFINPQRVDDDDWTQTTRELADLLTEHEGAWLLDALVARWDVWLMNHDRLHAALVGRGVSRRWADTLSPVLAGAHWLESCAEPLQDAAAWLGSHGWEHDQESDDINDGGALHAVAPEWQQALEHLLAHRVQWKTKDDGEGWRTLDELLANYDKQAGNANLADEVLLRRGLRRLDQRMLFVSNRAADLFRGTKWERTFQERLREAPGATWDQKQRLLGSPERGTTVPLP